MLRAAVMYSCFPAPPICSLTMRPFCASSNVVFGWESVATKSFVLAEASDSRACRTRTAAWTCAAVSLCFVRYASFASLTVVPWNESAALEENSSLMTACDCSGKGAARESVASLKRALNSWTFGCVGSRAWMARRQRRAGRHVPVRS